MHDSGMLSQILMLRNLLFISIPKTSTASVGPFWLFTHWDVSLRPIRELFFQKEDLPWNVLWGIRSLTEHGWALSNQTGQRRTRWVLLVNSPCAEWSWDMLMLSRGARGPPDPFILSKSSAIISCVGAGVQGREELMNGRANNNLILQHSGSFGLMNWLLLTGNPTDLQGQFDDLSYSQVPCCL